MTACAQHSLDINEFTNIEAGIAANKNRRDTDCTSTSQHLSSTTINIAALVGLIVIALEVIDSPQKAEALGSSSSKLHCKVEKKRYKERLNRFILAFPDIASAQLLRS
jgi:hypothetical protein